MSYLPFILFTVLANAAGQLMLKVGMDSFGTMTFASDTALTRLIGIVFHPWVFAGLLTYALSMASHMYVLSKVDVSFAYPFLSLTTVVIAVFAWLIFKEDLGAFKIGGIALICIGTVLVAQGESGAQQAPELVSQHGQAKS